MNWQGVDAGILAPAFAAGLAVLATHVPLGREVLRRGIIFLDLAVAQIAGFGVIAAGALFGETHGLIIQCAALGAALAGAIFLGWCEKRWPDVQEAIIGSAFVVAASASLVMLANDPHGGEQLKDLLVGQILWASWDRIGIATAVAAAVLALWFGMPGRRREWFYIVFAVAITTAVQLVGVYLVFATLIIPALAVRSRARRGLAIAWVTGAAGYAAGLALSGLLDLPAGPLIVLSLATVGFGVAQAAREDRATTPAGGQPG